MICRLCLINLNSENSVSLFDAYGGDGETQLIKMIAKYLHLEITRQDEISITICQECSNQLTAFHKYCAYVEQQQIALSNKFLVVEFDNQLNANDVPSELQEPMELQLKCEPEDEFVAETGAEMRLDKDNISYPSIAPESSRILENSTSTSSSNGSIEIEDETNKDPVELLNIKYRNFELDSKTLKENLEKIQCNLKQQYRTLTKNTLYLEEIFEGSKPKKKIKFFPIRSKVELEDIESKLERFSEKEIINHIQETLGNGSIERNLHLFISEKFLLQLNWDGSHQMIALKKTKLFSNYVYGAIKKVNQLYTEFEKSMRKGFRIYKNRFYRKTFKLKQINKCQKTC